MSKYEKTIARIISTPTPPDIKWRELENLLKHLGYERLTTGKTGGSRRKFYHKEKDVLISCHQPHNPPVLGRGCVRDIAEHLKDNGFTE